MNRFALIFLMLLYSCGSYGMSCGDFLGHQEDLSIHSDVKMVLDQFEFPAEADVKISDPLLRRAIYDAFGGKDIYTGQEIAFEDMHIDHFVPRSKGGPDNIYNYVVSSSSNNVRKNAAFDPIAAVPMLTFIRTVYAPKVLKLYQEAKAKEAAAKEAKEREAQRRAEERGNAQTRVPPTRVASRSQKVVGREVTFSTPNDERTIRSVVLLKEYIDANPNMVGVLIKLEISTQILASSMFFNLCTII